MGKLIITGAEGGSRELQLDRERITIGRHADNDICLNDKAVSGHHAVIVTVLHDSFLEDLNSTNGTMVNGRQIAKHALVSGDVISIGRNSLAYHSDAQANEDLDKTMILRPSQMASAFSPPPAAPRPAPAPAAPAPAAAAPASKAPEGGKPLNGKLRVVTGSSAGKELDLTKALTTIGKPGVQVAAITRRADGYYIVHVSGNGNSRPVVNGAEIDAQASRLNDGDTIEIAGTKMTFVLN
jgi:pSer/pThr/pTyr-binding forkhead associated (FHA) protein